MNTPFVDLLHRDEFSLKQALGNTKTILPILKERNQKYYAVSNYCEISNWVQQLFACKDNDIVPILGMEAFVNNFRYQADGFDKINVTNLVSSETKSVYDLNETERDLVTLDYPIDLFARTIEGYYNIIQIHNDSQLYGVDKRPRTSDPFLEKHCKGIIAVLPTPFSEVASLVFNGMEEDALAKFRHYQSLFDKVYLTVSLVDDPEYKEINESIIQFAQKNNILVVPVCCSHYHMPSYEEAFFTLKKLSKLRGGMFYEVDTCKGMFYRSREDVDYLFEKKFKSEIFTEEVYKKLMYNLDELLTEFSLLDIDYSVKLPKFENGPEKLKEKAWSGFIERGYDKKGPEYIERFNYEIENIVGAGFADYFLVLEEVFNWYRKDLKSVSAIGRGSAGGSLVLNCIGCTSLDPIQNNLLFERFLDASRLREVVESGGQVSGADMPDVDSDMATTKKELVKDHFAHVYGEKCTASIGTCGLMKTKSVLKDLARLYEVPMEEINDVTAGEMRSYMDDDENPMPLEKLKEMFPGLDALLQRYPQMGKTFEKLRGSITNWGKHAGGVLITDFDLTEQVPVRRDNEGKLVTCWQEGIAARELGQMGFIKFDILAIDQLNIFEHTIQLIKETTGKEIKVDDIPLGDYKALSQMNEHDSVCVFQFDTDLCPRVVDHMKGIHTFEDLGSLSTLMRPAALSNKFDTEFGKRRQNSKNIYIPDCLKPYLGPTFGLPIYQEHIMQAGMYLADMNKKDAYKFMKLLYKGKMTKDLIPYWKEKFLEGCKEKIETGEVEKDYPEELFNQLLAFQGYGFPKAHATAYSVYSAIGLWFKAYYPLQFMCANLSVTDRSSSRLNQRVRYCQSKGFRIYPPDVRNAGSQWKIHEGGLMAPLSNLKGFGVNDVLAVEKNRPYSSVTDFMDKTGLGKAKFETLVFGGALDCFGEREFLYNWYHEFYTKKSKSKKSNQMELFFDDIDQSDCFDIKTAFSQFELDKTFEDLNGFSIQENLLIKYASYLKDYPEVKTIGDALARKTNKRFYLLCRLIEASPFTSKTGREFVKLVFSDGVDTIDTVMQRINYDRYTKSLKAGNVMALPVQLADSEGIYIDNLDKKEIRILES